MPIREISIKTPSKRFVELDCGGEENMFNASSSYYKTCGPETKSSTKQSIDVEKIIYNMNYFPNKPKVLSMNPVTKEDPSWGNSKSKAMDLRDMTEQKGYYMYLSTFLEETVSIRREPVCTSVIPFVHDTQSTGL